MFEVLFLQLICEANSTPLLPFVDINSENLVAKVSTKVSSFSISSSLEFLDHFAIFKRLVIDERKHLLEMGLLKDFAL